MTKDRLEKYISNLSKKDVKKSVDKSVKYIIKELEKKKQLTQ